MIEIQTLLKKNGSLNYHKIDQSVETYLKELSSHLHIDSSNAERVYNILNKIDKLPTCPVCNRPLKFINLKRGYTQFCSRKCGTTYMHAIRTDEKKLEIKEKVQSTVQKKFGVGCVFQSKEIKERIYTPEHNLKRTQAIVQSVRRKYGVDNVFQIPEVKERIKEAHVEKYGVPFWNQQHLTSDFLNDDYLKLLHHEKKMSCSAIAHFLNINVTTVIKHLGDRGIEQKYHNRSFLEVEMKEFLLENGVDFIENDRTVLGGKEIDFYIPSMKIGIEMCGVYWHSSIFKHSNYHQEKVDLCEAKGIRLFQIFEDEWVNMKEACKKSILHALHKSEKGIYARNLTIREISWQEAKVFLDEHHLQKSGTAGNYRIGAFDCTGALVAVMVFGYFSNEMKNKDHIIEMKRFVTDKRNHPGIGSKMFNYATKKKNYERVIAFVDRRWFSGSFKFKSGFRVIDKTKPSLWYVRGTERKHRQFISKQQLITMGFEPSLPKEKILAQMGFVSLYDAGKLKLEWKCG